MFPPSQNSLKKLIVTADLGRLKAFVATFDTGSNTLVLVEDVEMGEPLATTDREGRFPGGKSASMQRGLYPGEPHDSEQETERRQIQELAARIDEVVKRHKCELWNLAVPAWINRRVVASLSQPARERLSINLQADLVGLPMPELAERFSISDFSKKS